MVSGRNFSL
uniref:Uncharacterized protein n=1 Tax=Rhizophora mucronata TaxID=61149 RepID=A0A2P2Q2T8_RHIMU